MSRTIVQQYRDAGDLVLFCDYRGGNLLDQSGNGHVITYPSDAHLSRFGLRCFSAPATVAIDMSAIKNMCVFFQIAGRQADAVNSQTVMEFTAEGAVTAGGWQAFDVAAADSVRFRFASVIDATSGAVAINTRTDSYFCSGHFDRRLSYEAVKAYEGGIVTTTATTDDNTNDGSSFADDTLYIMGREDNTEIHQGILQAFGIVDFSTTQWTATEQALHYSQVRDRETI